MTGFDDKEELRGKHQGIYDGYLDAVEIYVNGDKQFYTPLVRIWLNHTITRTIFWLGFMRKTLERMQDKDIFSYCGYILAVLTPMAYLLSLYKSKSWKVAQTCGNNVVMEAELNRYSEGKTIYVLELECPPEIGAPVNPDLLTISAMWRTVKHIELCHLPVNTLIDVLRSIQQMLVDDAHESHEIRKAVRWRKYAPR